jgi:hypothetical protein
MNCLLRSGAPTLGLLMLFVASAFGQGPIQQAIQQLSQVEAIVGHQIQNASPEVKKAVSEVPQVTPADLHQITAPQNPSKTITVVSDSQKKILLAAVNSFTEQEKRRDRKYSWLAIAFLIAGAVFALLGSIFNFIKWNTTAGIVGLIVVAVVGFPNVYPIPALADFYSSLATQAVALQTDCELKNPFTEEDYNSSESQLKLLILYDANNRPKFGSTKVSIDDLTKQLQTFKTTTNIAATAAH